jgi:chromosome segregation ATPase
MGAHMGDLQEAVEYLQGKLQQYDAANQELATENSSLVEENCALYSANRNDAIDYLYGQLDRYHEANEWLFDECKNLRQQLAQQAEAEQGHVDELQLLNHDEAVQYLYTQLDRFNAANQSLYEQNNELIAENMKLMASAGDGSEAVELGAHVEHLERKLQQFVEANQELYEQNGRFEEENAALRSQDKSATVRAMGAHMGDLQEAVEYLQGKLQQYDAANQELYDSCCKLMQSAGRGDGSTSTVQDEVDALYEKLYEVNLENESLSDQLESACEQLSSREGARERELQGRVRQLSTQLHKVQMSCEELTEENESLRANVATSTSGESAHITHLYEELDTAHRINEQLMDENTRLRSTPPAQDGPSQLHARVEYLERKLQKFAEANQELYEEYEKCEEENEALRKGNESEAVQYLYGQLEQFNAENEELKSNNEKHAERTAELNAKLGDYQEANQSLFDENEQLTDEADTLSERLIAFYQANQELFEQAEELAEELDVLRKGNTDDTVKYLYKQVEELSTRLQGAHGENMELSDRLEEAYTRLQGALATVSYLQAQRTSNASSETEILEDKYRCMEIECETLREVVAHQEASMANLRQLHADSRAEQQGYASFATAPQLPWCWCSLRSTTRSSVQMH